ncbi:MAG: hypothetical protein J6Y34_08190 [Bacteroidales bacterium]|nr:hypothetical protein [Bacteroidales bacterium]
MCTCNIRINDTLFGRVRSVFQSEESFQQWLEGQVESVLLNFDGKIGEVPPCSYSEEEMKAIVKERIKSLEEGTAKLLDGEEVFAQISARYGLKA